MPRADRVGGDACDAWAMPDSLVSNLNPHSLPQTYCSPIVARNPKLLARSVASSRSVRFLPCLLRLILIVCVVSLAADVCNKPLTISMLEQPQFAQLQALVLFNAGSKVLQAVSKALPHLKSLLYFDWQPEPVTRVPHDFSPVTLTLPASVKALVFHASTYIARARETTAIPTVIAPNVEVFFREHRRRTRGRSVLHDHRFSQAAPAARRS